MDEKIFYMGLWIETSKLLSKAEVLSRLKKEGAKYGSLAKIRQEYLRRFGKELAWQYSVMDGTDMGAVILPVQEGFLWIPISSVVSGKQRGYRLNAVELLDTGKIRRLLEEQQAYNRDLQRVFTEIKSAITGSASEPPDILLQLPEGLALKAIANNDPDYPSIRIQLLGPAAHMEEEILCFAEYNSDRPEGHRLCIGLYTQNDDEPAYYGSYVPYQEEPPCVKN